MLYIKSYISLINHTKQPHPPHPNEILKSPPPLAPSFFLKKSSLDHFLGTFFWAPIVVVDRSGCNAYHNFKIQVSSIYWSHCVIYRLTKKDVILINSTDENLGKTHTCMTLNSYSEMKGYKCDTVEKVKKEWVLMITTTASPKWL